MFQSVRFPPSAVPTLVSYLRLELQDPSMALNLGAVHRMCISMCIYIYV